jgi:hypothetical protein
MGMNSNEFLDSVIVDVVKLFDKLEKFREIRRELINIQISLWAEFCETYKNDDINDFKQITWLLGGVVNDIKASSDVYVKLCILVEDFEELDSKSEFVFSKNFDEEKEKILKNIEYCIEWIDKYITKYKNTNFVITTKELKSVLKELRSCL